MHRVRQRTASGNAWLTPDPLGLEPDVNNYRYVGNRVTTARDPSGMDLLVSDSSDLESIWRPLEKKGLISINDDGEIMRLRVVKVATAHEIIVDTLRKQGLKDEEKIRQIMDSLYGNTDRLYRQRNEKGIEIIMVFGEVIEEELQFAEVGQVHEVGVVEDGGQRFAGAVEAHGLFDELAFAGEGGVFELDAEGLTQDFDGVGVGVQSSCHGGDEVLVLGESLEGLLEDTLAGAGDAEHQAESPLLTVDFERVQNLLLSGQEFDFAAVERVLGQSVEGADHGWSFRRRRPLATASRSRAGPMRWPLE